jgi:serine/threonine-protein kinase
MSNFGAAGLMDELRDRLQASLGASFTIERELTGGGMSRVFVAHETSLGRDVVVKVLSPDLAGLNIERFRREVMVAAKLQHPHIVPVHAAGETQGIPYYTMPFIEGESLRSRLAAGERFSVAETISILHDVIDALAYAHERGVVHRDIKPDNILMSRQHAVVTDFGVAKALSDADVRGYPRPGAHTTETGKGIAIGTPAYMAPEQAAGDPSTDHRADVYAFGVLAYELLAGAPPFSGRARHEVLAAHLAERPTPIAQLRSDVTPALAGLIMRCLEKRPADRPQTAADVRQALESLVTPGEGTVVSLGTRRDTRSIAKTVLGTLGTAAVVGFALYMAWPRTPPVDETVVAIAPFRITGADPSLRYLREGMLDLLATKLTGDGGPRSADPRALLSAWRRVAGSDTADLLRAEALDVAEELGAGQLLQGDIGGTPDRLVLNASLVRVRDGRAQAQASVTGPADSLAQLVDQLTARLLALGAGQAERLSSLTSTSLPALRAFLNAQTHYRKAHYRLAATEYDRALATDSTFALAALGLAQASGWYGDPSTRLRGMTVAWQYRDRLSARDRALLDATIGPNFPGVSSFAELHAARQRYLALSPDRPEAWFELGDGLFHFGMMLDIPDAHARAAEALRRAIALDSAFSPAIEHLTMLEARSGDTAAVRRLGEMYLRLDSTSENASGVRWRMAVALDDRRLRQTLDERWEAMSEVSLHTIRHISQLDGLPLADVVASLQASMAKELTRPERMAVLMTAHDLALNTGHPDRAVAAMVEWQNLAQAPRTRLREHVRDALFWDGDTTAAIAAIREITRTTSAPIPADSAYRLGYYVDLALLELWKLIAREDSSTTRRTLATLAAITSERDGSAAVRLGSQWQILFEAMLASMARRPDAAVHVTRLDSLMRTGPGGGIQDIGNLTLARLKEKHGDVRGALAAVRRRDYFLSRPTYLSTFLREEGRLAALAGDRESAIEAYRHYLTLRANPAPEFKRDVENVRAELERLERTSAGD